MLHDPPYPMMNHMSLWRSDFPHGRKYEIDTVIHSCAGWFASRPIHECGVLSDVFAFYIHVLD